LAETDSARRAGCLGGGEGLEGDTLWIEGLQANADLGAATVKDGSGVTLAEAQNVDGVV